ncbi:MAG: UbiA family prenyltransferase [Candidatus Nomurabacteria bacterium]|nr:UbiA family prenyltransferase [Candidatus Nomurabacteria bacterium]
MKEDSILREVIKSLRLSMTIPAGLLVHVGYAVVNKTTNWWIVFIVFCIACLTMIQNDYHDRDNDRRKGKYFASIYTKELQGALYLLWEIVVLTIVICYKYSLINIPQFVLLIICIAVGIFYSYSRKLVFIPSMITALVSASPLLFVSMEEYYSISIMFFLIVFLLILGREVIKDFENRNNDMAYKQTIFTQRRITEKNGLRFAGVLFFLAGSIAIFFPPEKLLIMTFYYVGIFCFLASGFLLFFANNLNRDKDIAKLTLDMGIFIVIISLSCLPYVDNF